ncbi:type II toxin-antitoxin system VapC family toxin [Candidatus Woesearchaeota archaeon]|nr:type II toxin-antitoxin system VapC family toxin [Candidatus Woesearchaeota archaeon]
MKKIFVDSDYLIDYLRRQAYTKPLIEKIQSRQAEASISVVTVFELYVGALLSNNPGKRFEDVETLLSWFRIVDINKEIMLIAAKINVDLRKKGFMIGIQDVLIAASSISANTPLITNNTMHFQKIEGLKLE